MVNPICPICNGMGFRDEYKDDGLHQRICFACLGTGRVLEDKKLNKEEDEDGKD